MNITATKDSPRTLRHVRTGETTRCTDQSEYLTLTTASGYRDITDERSSSSSGGSGSSSAASSSSSSSDVPAQSANKDVWVEHAVARGADRQTAEGQSKADLIAAYGA